MTTACRLNLLGQLAFLSPDSTPLRLRANSKRLLAVLALHPDGRSTRLRLASLFWDATPTAAALRNLRQALYTCRRELGPFADTLILDGESVGVDLNAVQLDLNEAVESLNNGLVPDAMSASGHLSDRILAAIPRGGTMYESWVQIAARDWETHLQDKLIHLINNAAPTQRKQAARALLEQDPGHEVAARALIKTYADEANIGSALKVYARLWHHLDEEYGMEPGAKTQELITWVKGLDGTEPTTAAPALDEPGQRCTIRVETTVVEPNDDAARRIADLFRSELIVCLSCFREFDVYDGQFCNQDTDYRVACTSMVSDKKINMAVHLTQTSDGSILLGHRLGDIGTDWYHLQSNMTGRIASACSAAIYRKRLDRLTRQPAVARLVDHWVAGQTKLFQFRPENWQEAKASYETCIALDENFSPAYSALAQLLNSHHLASPGLAPDQSQLFQARDHANKAVTLDLDDSRAHLARAWSHCMLRDFAQAELSFDMALLCNSEDLWTLLSAALGKVFCGNEEHGTELATRCRSEQWTLSPQHMGYLATIDFLRGDFDACLADADSAGAALINIPAWKAAALMQLNRPEEAAKAWAEFDRLARASWVANAPPGTHGPLSWLQRCFPIANADRAREFSESIAAAARYHQAHCEQI